MRYCLSTLMVALAVVPPIVGGAIASCIIVHIHDRRDATRSQLKNLENALLVYELALGEVPPKLDALVRPPANLPNPRKWAGPYLKEAPRDPWGNAYEYKAIDEHNFRIWSCGPDGVSGNSQTTSA